MSRKNIKVDGPGDNPGGLLSVVRSPSSANVFSISTAFQDSTDCWATVIFPCLVRKSWFGLSENYLPLVDQPLYNFLRNSQQEAHVVHALVRDIVANQRKDSWFSFFPDMMPPDGFSKKAQERFERLAGDSLNPEIRSRFRY